MRIAAPLSLALSSILLLGLFPQCAPAQPQEEAQAVPQAVPQEDAGEGTREEPQDAPTEIIQYGDHFAVICWFVGERTQDRLARETLGVVEHTWEGATTLYGLSSDPLGDLVFQVNVDGNRKSFMDRVNGIQLNAVEKDFGWSHHGSRAAFVRLQPPVPDRVLDALGMPSRTLRRAAREAARLALLEASGGSPEAPAWFAAGSTAWLSTQALQAAGRAAQGFESPYLAARLHTVRTALGEQRLPAFEEFLNGYQGLLEAHEVDALRELFFTFLMQSSSLEAWAELGPRLTRGKKIENLTAVLATLLGLNEALDLEPAFYTWMDGSQPRWREQEPNLSVHTEGWSQTPILGRNAVCWLVEPAGQGDYVISGEFMLFRDRSGMGQVNVLLGELDGNYIQVTFNTVAGVNVFEYEHQTATYRPLTSKGLENPIPSAEWVSFTIWYTEERVTIRIHDQDLRPFDVTGRSMSGAWGIGAFKGTSVIWRNVSIAPYR